MVLITSISKNIFLTILCYKSDYANTIIYRLIMELYVFVVPIIPAFGEYINSILSISLPIILSFVVLVGLKRKVKEKPKNKKKGIISVIIMFLLLLLILINSGYFKYRTFTIGSNSMIPYMARGDVVVVEKYKEDEKRIIGVEKIRIKYIGLPSVWLQEIFK